LSPGQQAVIVASAQDWSLAHPAHRPISGAAAPLNTTASRAAQSGASVDTQKRADKVAKSNPELAKAVGRGEISLPDAVEQITGKRPGAKAKPVVAEPAEPIESFETDLRHDLIDADRENRRLTAVVASIEATDTRRELVVLHERIASLEGRLGQEMTTKNEAIKQVKYYKNILDKITAKLNLNSFTDILGALK
jgi:DNA integrity scanning protein DisA with diadenylate cyclase activity